MPDEKKTVPGPEALDAGIREDDDATSEAAAFVSGKLEEISKRNEHSRREKFRDHVSCGALIVFWVLITATLLAIIAIAWHYLAPGGLVWLNESQLTALRAFIFSGAVIAAAGGYVQRYM